jgi:hypothetical protein
LDKFSDLLEQFLNIIPGFKKKGLEPLPEPDIPKIQGQNEVADDYIVVSPNSMVSSIDFDIKIKDAAELISLYRKIANNHDVESAIEEVCSEAIIQDAPEIVTLNLDNIETSDKIKDKIQDEFSNILKLFNFKKEGYDIFKQFYVDGRMYIQILVKNNTIIKLKILNPLKLFPAKDKTTGETFFYYKEDMHKNEGYKIHKDHIAYITSGIKDGKKGITLSNLHRSIIPLNQLQTMEQSVVIYRLVRAPERRVFRIDVGRLPKTKAEAYVKRMMNQFRNKLTYDVDTGEVKQRKNQIVMAEDFWFPKDSDGNGTEVDTLDGGQQLGEIQDVVFFKKKLFRSLKVPFNRVNADEDSPTINFGNSGELTREELKFYKYVVRTRNRFENAFVDILKTACLLKNICKPDEWKELFHNEINFIWGVDNYYEEKKEAEIMEGRLDLLSTIGEFVGLENNGYYSRDWVAKNILKMTEDDIEEMKKQMEEEAKEAEEAGIETVPPEGEEGEVEPAPKPKEKKKPEAGIEAPETDKGVEGNNKKEEEPKEE